MPSRRRGRHAPRSRQARVSASFPTLAEANPPASPRSSVRDPRSFRAERLPAVRQLLPSLPEGVTYAAALRKRPLPLRVARPRVRQLRSLGTLRVRPARVETSTSLPAPSPSPLPGLVRLRRCVSRPGGRNSRFTPRARSRRNASRAAFVSTSPRPPRSSHPSPRTHATAQTAKISRGGPLVAAADARSAPRAPLRARRPRRYSGGTFPDGTDSSPCTIRSRQTTATSRSRCTGVSSRPPAADAFLRRRLGIGKASGKKRKANDGASDEYPTLSRSALLVLFARSTAIWSSTRVVTA